MVCVVMAKASIHRAPVSTTALSRPLSAKASRRTLTILAAKGGEEGGKTFDNSVYGTIAKNANYMLLGSLIAAAGLDKTLMDADAKFTLFAPDDDAFAAAAKKLGVTKLELKNLPNLADILKNHVISGEVKSTDLKEGAEVATLGKPLKVTLAGGAKVNGVKVKKTDIKVSNGILHAVTEVLV